MQGRKTHLEEQGERQGTEEQWERRKEKEAEERRGEGEWGEEEVPHAPSSERGRLRARVYHVGGEAREGRAAASKGDIAAFLSPSFQ